MILTADPVEPVRLDVYLSEVTGHTRSQIKILIAAGLVTVGGTTVKAGAILKGGESVEINGTVREIPSAIAGEDFPLDIVYEDEELAVVNKAQGMVVHPAAGHYGGTLVNALIFRYRDLPKSGGEFRAGIVHRLDKDTSGLLVIAKTERAHAFLADEIASKRAERRYFALLDGVFRQDSCDVVSQIGRDSRDRKKMAVLPEGEGRYAVTHCEVLARYGNRFSLCEFVLSTGRTHQIRVHASKILRCPIVGDPLYGLEKQKFRLNGQLLHAYRLSFHHPVSGEYKTFTAPIPNYFRNVLDQLTPTEITAYAREKLFQGESNVFSQLSQEIE